MLKRVFRFFRLDLINKAHNKTKGMTAWAGADSLLKDFKVGYVVEGAEHLKQYADEAFITVSNHPYGAVDGISLSAVMGKYRPDYKMMVNDILMRIKVLAPNFIGVKPNIGYRKGKKQSSLGLRETIAHIRGGHPLCLFPAGAVSMYENRSYIADREWQESAIKLINASKVPVIPIFFQGLNKPYFYKLERIHVALRTVFLTREVFNKPGHIIRIIIGRPITVEEQLTCKDLSALRDLLRARTYELSGNPQLK